MFRFSFLTALAAAGAANAYWLMGFNNAIAHERIDPIVNPGGISAHSHIIFGSSAFRSDVKTSDELRAGMCTSIPIAEDKSAYWFPKLYFHWKNGSFSDVGGGAVTYYLFGNDGKAKAFPDNFRMISGTPGLRTYDPNSKPQLAITFLCLDFNGKSVTYNELPNVQCPSGIRAQVNFPMCWDGKNADSPDHQSHVAFPSEGADKGSCNDPAYPVTLPRIFTEIYWGTQEWHKHSSEAMNPAQPFVFSNGDPTGYSYHGDFLMGWDRPTLERALAPDGCTCNIYGSLDCCYEKGLFTKNTEECRITPTFEETTTGTLSKLPGNNPVTTSTVVDTLPIDKSPLRYEEVIEYKGKTPPRMPKVIPGSGGDAPPTVPLPSSPPAAPSPSVSAVPSESAPGVPSPSVPAEDVPAPSPSAPVLPSPSVPAGGDPVPSASTPVNIQPSASATPTPSAPTVPSPSVPAGSDPVPSAHIPELPGYPDYPKPSDVPPASPSASGGQPPLSSKTPSQPLPTNSPNPPYGTPPRPGKPHGPGHHNGTCRDKKSRRSKSAHRRRLTTSH